MSETNAPETPKAVKNIVFEILRYDPEKDKAPSLKEYTVPVPKGMTVLDGLLWIKENLDPTLAYRSSCRMGVCGSCGMFINGMPRLACNNQVLHLTKSRLQIKPMPNNDIIKDLVPDLEPAFDKHRSVKPFLIRDQVAEMDNPTGQYFQSREELTNYIQFSYCIKCGLCLSACPTVATDEQFTGPQALAQAWRYNADSRDEGGTQRHEAVDTSHGVWSCHFAGACSDACPKGVDPAFAIQLLKQDVFAKKSCSHKGGDVLPRKEEHVPKENIPAAPVRTV